MQNFSGKVNEIKVSYRSNYRGPELTSSRDSFNYLRCLWQDGGPLEGTIDHHESFIVLALNRANRVIGHHVMSKGGSSGTVVDPKVVFQALLNCHAQAFIVCHNHPSGTMKFSEADRVLNEKLKTGGKLLEIAMLDSIVIASNEYSEFVYMSGADEGSF